MAQDDTSKDVIRTQLAFIKDYDYSNEKIFLEKSGLLEKHLELLDSNEYFPTGIVELTADEVFVDGGGFNGDTVQEFFKRSNGKFDHVYSFEPDKRNFEELTQTIKKLHPKKGTMSAHPQGLYSENKTLRFNQKGIGSSISDSGDESIDVVTLDTFLNEEQRSKISFIKLDVEGAELEALAGMEKTIRNNRPKLAICVYHKTEHFWEVPFLIKQYNPEYRIYFRQHALSRLETVCYAI